ncbi:MAG: XRE family transcriptional regulator [Geminicoccaceae bacterium]
MAPLRQFGSPLMDAVQPMPFPVMQSMLDDAFQDGTRNYWKSTFVKALDDDAIDTLVGHANRMTSPLSAVVVEFYAGAASAVGPAETAFAQRQAEYDIGFMAQWTDPAEDATHTAWARAAWDAMRPFSSGGFLPELPVRESRTSSVPPSAATTTASPSSSGNTTRPTSSASTRTSRRPPDQPFGGGGLDNHSRTWDFRIRKIIPNMEFRAGRQPHLRLAERLRHSARSAAGRSTIWPRSPGVSRATLSRLENAEVSPTTDVLGRLCVMAHGLSLTRLLAPVEADFAPVVRREAQPLWRDDTAGFLRRAVSPPAGPLAAEIIEGTLRPGAHLAYAAPPVPGQEHHLLLLEGRLVVTLDGRCHALEPGDCLRYRLAGPSAFAADAEAGARYVLVLVGA